jgi:limonene-1,2-epoxide hydrolase
MADLIDTVRELQAALGRRDRAAILAFVAPDLEYHYHVGSKPLHGVDRFGKFLDGYFALMQDVDWKIERWAQNGDVLMTEGYEEYTDTQTGQRLTNRYMGSMEFRGGKIAKWRDYFQKGPVPGSGPGAAAAGAGAGAGAGASGTGASSPFV